MAFVIFPTGYIALRPSTLCDCGQAYVIFVQVVFVAAKRSGFLNLSSRENIHLHQQFPYSCLARAFSARHILPHVSVHQPDKRLPRPHTTYPHNFPVSPAKHTQGSVATATFPDIHACLYEAQAVASLPATPSRLAQSSTLVPYSSYPRLRILNI
jgi:hypothetical protein